MALAPGTRLGAYEVIAVIGAGGMGEVYRARDLKLGREVAIKVLPPAFADDPDRLARFTREAQSLAALNHPNIATVYGVEGHAIVMELLDGATLRAELAATVPPRRASAWGAEIANGLAAAHEKGIVHRDLKPENIFVTRDGRVKILDFGIARPDSGRDSAAAATTLAAGGTEPGVVLGTAGYMAPEQVRGQTVDARGDIFSLGVVLYEMLGGRRPFTGESAVETMNAILTADPPSFEAIGRSVPPAFERIVFRCLEKRPADRFHSAHDIALALEATSGATTQAGERLTPPRWRWGTALTAGSIIATVLLTGVVTRAVFAGRSTTPPTFRRLTYRQGTIETARFIPGSSDVVYSARWAGEPSALFTGRAQRREVQPAGHENASLFAVSAAQDVALMLSPRLASGRPMGTLATAPVAGGGARELATRVIAADFVADSSQLVYTEYTGEVARIMYPAGHVIYEAQGTILSLRCAPRGDLIAFFVIAFAGGPPVIKIIDHTGTEKSEIPFNGEIERQGFVTGLAWTPDAREILLSQIDANGQQTTISAVRLGAPPRVLWRGPGNAILQDVDADGALLLRYDDTRAGILAQRDGATLTTDLGWLDMSTAAAVSPSGDTLLISEGIDTPRVEYYARKVDGSPAIRLGAGMGLSWSPDGKQVLSAANSQSFLLTPIGPGTPRELSHSGVNAAFGWFLPDGRILLNGRHGSDPWRFYVLDAAAGQVKAIGPPALDHWVGQQVPSDDGKLIAGFPSGQNQLAKPLVVPLDGGPAISVAGFDPLEAIIRFTPDDNHLLVFDRDHLPVRIYSLDYRTGQRTLWREFSPADPTGIIGVSSVVATPDGRLVAYNYLRRLSTLYLIEGLR